jgi:hypothetical protein
MLNYADFSYRPDYGFKLYRKGQLVEQRESVQHAACFARVFNWFDGNTYEDYVGIYTLRCRKEFKEQSGNYCSLERPQILKLLRYMRRVFEIPITLTEDKVNYIFNFQIEGKPIKHKFVLTFSRVFFEFPYNEMAKDVLRLQEVKRDDVNFSKQSFLKLYHILCCSYISLWGSNHSPFLYPCKKVSAQQLRKVFQNGMPRVQDIFKGSEKLANEFSKAKLIGTARNVDWDANFEKREKIYYKQFKILKGVKSVRRRAAKKLQ